MPIAQEANKAIHDTVQALNVALNRPAKAIAPPDADYIFNVGHLSAENQPNQGGWLLLELATHNGAYRSGVLGLPRTRTRSAVHFLGMLSVALHFAQSYPLTLEHAA